jgi:hypothetical protein
MKKAYQGFPITRISRNFAQPQYTAEMVRKLLTRVREQLISFQSEDPLPWLLRECSSLKDYCEGIDKALWEEVFVKCRTLQACADEKLKTLDFDLGGGGNYPLLYFLVRFMRPRTVVETGVAAGFSSNAILSALKENGEGRLYSSDFPYFRIENPEKYIGFVVDEELKLNWTCLKRGDRSNLPQILSYIDKIDLFHYDSDKSYSGRAWAMNVVMPRMRKGGAVVMDDLNDNSFFEEFVTKNHINAKVFEFQNKYVGLFFVS